MKRTLLAILSLFAAQRAYSQNSVGPVELDSSFAPASATPGRVTVDYGGIDIATCYISYFNRITRQLTAVYVAGTADQNAFGIVRLTQEGILDPTFGTNGKAMPFAGRGLAQDMILLPDGAIRAAGDRAGQPALFGISSTGQSDSTFGTSSSGIAVSTHSQLSRGVFTTIDTTSVAGNNVIFGMGYSADSTSTARKGFYIARFDMSGQIDPSFGTNGSTLVPANIRIAHGHVFYADSVTQEQHIILAGISTDARAELLLCRLKQNGAVDDAFGTNGVLHTGLFLDGGSWFASKSDHGFVRPGVFDDKLIVAIPMLPTSSNLPITLIRFNFDGTVDTSYGSIDQAHGIISSPGLSSMDSVTSLVYSNDGSLIISGNSNGYGAASKFFFVGRIDSTFGVNGIAKLDNGFGTQQYSLIGFNPLGGGAQKRFIAVGNVASSNGSNYLVARFTTVPILRFSLISLDFGDVDTSSSKVLIERITNYDIVTHTIDTVRTGHPFLSIVPPVQSVVLAPGASMAFSVEFRPNIEIALQSTVTIMDTRSGDPQPTQRTLFMTGNGVAPKSGVKEYSPSILTVMPNPANTSLTVSGEMTGYRIVDALGRTVQSNAGRKSGDSIDISSLPNGVYFIAIEGAAGSSIHRMTVQH